MKHFMYLFFWLFAYGLYAQQVSKEVVSASGNSVKLNDLQVDYTIGEVITETATADSITLTQGFHQGKFVIVGVDDLPDFDENNFSFYPNPFNTRFSVEKKNTEEEFVLKVLNLAGQVVTATRLNQDITQIEAQNWANAFYLIQITDLNNQLVSSYKIIKTQ